MIHVDVKKLGNIPDGGGWRYVGRQQGKQNRVATPSKPRSSHHNLLIGTAYVHTVIDAIPGSPTQRSTAMKQRPPQLECSGVQCPGSLPGASRWNESSPTTDRLTNPISGGTPAKSWGSLQNGLNPTAPRQVERSNASTELSPMDGHSSASTSRSQPVEMPSLPGYTTTITTAPT